MLAHALAQQLEDMLARAQLEVSVHERISIKRDITLYSLAFYSMKLGFDLSFTLGSQVLRLPKSAGLRFNFHFGNTRGDLWRQWSC